jgi:hypothetical protein
VGAIDIAGQRYGSLVAIKPIGKCWKSITWECVCDCGATTSSIVYKLRSGKKTSCGCQRAANIGKGVKRHGDTIGLKTTAEYRIWSSMKSRCCLPTNRAFHWYGGRGITVCDRWMKFENFLADMGRRPSAKHSLDRADNDKGYAPGNCRWATQKEQTNNSRNNVRLRLGVREMTISEWSTETGIDQNTISVRVRRGWSVEKSLTTPPHNRGQLRKA